uniref:HMG box domain-containing protein n=1 Tax=Wuchereria bancrofti TaxID=6293 RepID=A0A1I8EPB3_WUCBA
MAKTGPKGSKKSSKRSSGASTSKQKKTKKVKDPNAPKRAKSAYMFWLLENRSRIAKPGMSVIDVSKAAGVEWGKVKDKSKYEKMASQDKQRYEAGCKIIVRDYHQLLSAFNHADCLTFILPYSFQMFHFFF